MFKKDGTREDIRNLQVGQSIVVKYTGNVEESLPAGIYGVAEIIVE